MWDVVFVAPRVLAVAAMVAWCGYCAIRVTRRDRHGRVEAVGWVAATLTALAVAPYVALPAGLLLFLPALWFEQTSVPGAVGVVAWCEALALTVGVVLMGRHALRNWRRARFLAAGVVILGLGSVWMGRYLATIDWMPHPS